MSNPWATAIADLTAPRSCAGCALPGTGWCERCDRSLAAALRIRRARPDPCPPGLPPVVTAGPYAGKLAAVVAAYKDGDRRDLAAILAPVAAVAIAAALGRLPDRVATVALVPVPASPSSLRRRGDRPLATLVRRAAGLLTEAEADADAAGSRSVVVIERALVVRRRVGDQARLDAATRQRNLAGAMAAAPLPGGSAPDAFVIVDDVMTTGATIAEAARALRAGPGRGVEPQPLVVAATLAAAVRRGASPAGRLR